VDLSSSTARAVQLASTAAPTAPSPLARVVAPSEFSSEDPFSDSAAESVTSRDSYQSATSSLTVREQENSAGVDVPASPTSTLGPGSSRHDQTDGGSESSRPGTSFADSRTVSVSSYTSSRADSMLDGIPFLAPPSSQGGSPSSPARSPVFPLPPMRSPAGSGPSLEALNGDMSPLPSPRRPFAGEAPHPGLVNRYSSGSALSDGGSMRSGYGSVLEGIPFHLAFPGGVGESERGSVASMGDSERDMDAGSAASSPPQSRQPEPEAAGRGSEDSLAAAAEVASRFQ
jgi:hypothetical protein